MTDSDLSPTGKAALGAACAACCGVPMLVILGFASLGLVLTVGTAVGSALAVVGITYRVVRRRTTPVPLMARRLLVAGGVALSAFGLWLAGTSADGASAVLSVALALLAVAALLVLESARGDYAGGA